MAKVDRAALLAKYKNNQENKNEENKFLEKIPTIVDDLIQPFSEKPVAKEPKKEIKEPKVQKETKKYDDEKITICFALTEEQSKFIKLEANRKGKSQQSLFEELMINAISKASPGTSDLEEEFQTIQRNKTLRMSLKCSSNLVKDIKKTASMYCMKYSSYIAFVIQNNINQSKKK